jgi:hypothetical protein
MEGFTPTSSAQADHHYPPCEHESTKDGYCLNCGDAYSPLNILKMNYSSSLCFNPEARFRICQLDDTNLCIHCGHWSGMTTHIPVEEQRHDYVVYGAHPEGNYVEKPQEYVVFGGEYAEGRLFLDESDMDYMSTTDDGVSTDEDADEEMANLPDDGWFYFSPQGRRKYMEADAAAGNIKAAEPMYGTYYHSETSGSPRRRVDPITYHHRIENGVCGPCGIRVDVGCPNPECGHPQIKDFMCFNCGFVLTFDSMMDGADGYDASDEDDEDDNSEDSDESDESDEDGSEEGGSEEDESESDEDDDDEEL